MRSNCPTDFVATRRCDNNNNTDHDDCELPNVSEDLNNTTADLQSGLNDNVKSTRLKRVVVVKSKKSLFKKHRKKLSRLFIALLLASLTMTCLTLSAMMYAKFSERMDLCDSEQCMRIASSLKEIMDTSVDPCDDFHKYVCGRWPKVHPYMLDGHKSHNWPLERSAGLLQRIPHLIVQNFSDRSDVPRAVHEVQLLFLSCLNVQAQYNLGLQPLFDLLDELKLPRVPAAIEPRQISDQDDDDNIVKQMARVKRMLWSDVFFGLQIGYDPRDNTKNILFLDKPHFMHTPFPRDKSLEKSQKYDRVRGNSSEAIFASRKLYIAEVLKQIVSNGTNDLIYCETRQESDTLPLAEIDDLAEQIINLTGVINNMIYRSTNASTLSDFDDETEEIDDEDYMLLDDLQKLTDDYVRSVNESITPRQIWRPFVEELLQEVEVDFDPARHKVYVGDLEFLQEIALVLSSTDEQLIETMIWWKVVKQCVQHTSWELRKIWNIFFKDATELGQRKTRSMYCSESINELMDMAVAWLMVEPQLSRNHIAEMLENIKKAFMDFVLKDIDWMDGPTKVAIVEKNRKMKSLIGFPDWLFEDGQLDDYYDGINITEDAYFNNMLQIIRAKNIKKLMNLAKNDTHDDSFVSWPVDPIEVNPLADVRKNLIVIPFGILQFPFYGLGLEAMNYGAIGSVLGHELTHGFDTVGRRFDSAGNLRRWWNNETIAKYKDRAICFVQQYDKYYIPEVHKYIDGKRTLGENIADNGGLRQAYEAYQLWKSKHDSEPLLPGFGNFTHEQLFFLSYAHMWCNSQTNDELNRMLRNSHCPGHVRLQQVLRNSEHFSRAFSCPVGSPMNPKNKCQLW